MEFKCVKKLTELKNGCDAALQQIENRSYIDEPIEEGCRHIIKYGICFIRSYAR